MSAPMGHTCATTMLTVSTPWAHIAVCARMDSLEMDSTAQVTHTNPCAKPHCCFFKICMNAWCVYGLCFCVWSPQQTAMSVQRTATCVRVATVWTCQEASAVNVTWVSSPLLMAKPARVSQYDTATPDYPGSRPLKWCPHPKLRWVIQKGLVLLWWMVVCFPVWRNNRSEQMLLSSGTREVVFWTWEVHNMVRI